MSQKRIVPGASPPFVQKLSRKTLLFDLTNYSWAKQNLAGSFATTKTTCFVCEEIRKKFFLKFHFCLIIHEPKELGRELRPPPSSCVLPVGTKFYTRNWLEYRCCTRINIDTGDTDRTYDWIRCAHDERSSPRLLHLY